MSPEWNALERIGWVLPTDEHQAEYGMLQRTSGDDLIAVWFDREEGWPSDDLAYFYREKIGGVWEANYHRGVGGEELQKAEPYLGRRLDNELHLIGTRYPTAAQRTRDEYYHYDPPIPIYGPFWISPEDYPIAQQFTCGLAGTCVIVKLPCYRSDACGDIAVQIRADDANVPGAVLAQATLYEAAIPMVATWVSVGFAAPATLVPDTKYWIYLPAIGNNYFRWGWATEYFAIGSHTGGDGAATLTDSTASFTEDYVGRLIENSYDGSSGIISAVNSSTNLSVTLTGGIDNDWDTGDVYIVPDMYNRGFAWSSDPSPPWDYSIGDFGFETWIETASSGVTDLVDFIWNGVSWNGPFGIDPDDSHYYSCHTCVDGANVMHLAAWIYRREGTNDLKYNCCDEFGWADPIILDTEIRYHVRIHADSEGRIYVIYWKYDAGVSYYYVNCRADGVWGGPELVHTLPTIRGAEWTTFIDASDVIHIVFWEHGGTEFAEIKGAVGSWGASQTILAVPAGKRVSAIEDGLSKGAGEDGYFTFYSYPYPYPSPKEFFVCVAESNGGAWSYSELLIPEPEPALRQYFTGPTLRLDESGGCHVLANINIGDYERCEIYYAWRAAPALGRVYFFLA